MKEKMQSALGGFGMILWYAISTMYSFAPLLVLGFPVWVDIILVIAMMTLPMAGGIIRFALFVWAFIRVFSMPINIITVIFFICAIIFFIFEAIPAIKIMFTGHR